MRSLNVVNSFGLIIFFVGLTACGGGGGGSDNSGPTTTTPTTTTPTTTTPTTPTTPTTSSRAVSGGGVKGPLANAVVTVYAFDPSQPGFKGSVIATGSTNAAAAITGLALPFPITPPYIMEFTSIAGTTDITTGQAPVIGTLRSVITEDLLNGGGQIYATPLTTMAVDIAIANSNASTTAAQFETALTDAASQVVSTLGFGMASSIDIFDTPPLVDDSTVSSAEQADVAAYRTAVEAVTAIAYQIDQQTAGGDTDGVLAELAADLADGGGINGSAGTQINANTLQVLDQDPATLPIPNEPGNKTVGEVQAILVAETTTTGTSTSTTQLAPGGSIATSPEPAAPNPDSDGDLTLNVNDAFPNDPAEQVDTDGDGIGDNADPDDDNNGILDVDEGQTPTPVANDTDLDGLEDSLDNCPAIFNPSQTNTDGNALPDPGDACDTDDDDDGEPDATDAFPLNAGEQLDTDSDGQGNVADSDDDNDGVNDGSDTGVAPLGAPSEGTACSLLRDCDGDGVFDGSDFDPTDAAVTSNFAPVANDDSVTVDEDAAPFAIPVTTNDTDNDGNPGDTVTLDSIGSNDTAIGTAVINGNNIDYTPAAEASGIDTFTYTVTDGTSTATGTVTVTVNDLNDDPTDILLDSSDVDETQAAGAAVGTLSSTDVDSGAFTYTLVAGAGDTDNASFGIGGAVLETAAVFDFETQNSFSIRVQTDDGAGGLFEEAFTITVNDLNDAPTDIALDNSDVDENQSAGTAVGTFSATDVDSAAFTYSLVAGAGDTDNAAFGITGAVLETAMVFDFETKNSYSIRVQTDDGAGGLFEEAFTITVNDLNDAPTDSALDSSDVDENQPAGTVVGNLSTTDADSADTHSYTLVAGAGDTDNAAFAIVGAQLQTSAVFDFETQNSFSIRVQTDDGAGGTFEEAFVVTINDVNDAPTDIALDSSDVDENQAAGAAVGTLSSTDVDSAAFTYTLVAGAGDTDNAAFSIGGAVLETAAVFDFETQNSYSIRVQTDDGAGGLFEEAFTITVNDLNDDPTDIGLDNTSVEENQAAGTAVGALTTTDADTLDTHTYTLVPGAGDFDNASFTIVGAQLQTGATFDFETQNSYSIRVQSNDGNGGLFEEAFTITVNDLNDDPTDIALDSTDVDENQPVGTAVGTLSSTDVDSTTFNYTLVAGAGDTDNAAFGITGAVLETAASFDFETQDSYSIRVQTDDREGGTFEEALTITVNNLNEAPVITQTGPLGVIMSEDGAPTAFVAPTIDATDAEGDSLTWTGSAAGNGTATVSGTGASPIVGYAPNANFFGSDSFDVSVSDGNSSATITVDVTVQTVNDAPVANDDSAGVLPGATVLIAVLDNDTDVEGSSLTPSFGTASAGIVSDNGDGRASFDATGLTAGTVATFTYTVNDGDTDSNTATVTVTVTTNQAPVITQTGPLSVTMDEDGSPTAFVAPTIDATDVESDSLTWDLAAPASDGTATVSGTGASPTVTYTPDADFAGSDSFDVRVNDATGSATITINVTVGPINDAPVITQTGPLSVTMDEDGSPTAFVAPTIDATDVESDSLTWDLAAPASDGTATVSGTGASPTVTYTPDPDFAGPDSFDVRVSDAAGSATITVNVTVDPVNDDPLAVDDSATVIQDDMVIIDVLTNDTDIENDSLTIASGDPTDAANGIATNNNDGTFDYVPNPGYVGPDSFTYTVEDGNGGSDVGTVNITVNPLGSAATVAALLDQAQGGGVGMIDSWDDTLPQFDYWRDSYDTSTGTLVFIDEEYDYDTEAFVDVSGFDSYWLTSIGTWELPSSIDVITADAGDGSMVVAIASVTENVASLRIRAFTQDIDGDLISDYLDTNWAAQMLNPAATFGPGAQLVTSYTFEDLTDSYSFELEDWCESENPARWTALNNSCNGVYINSTDSYATSLAELQVSTAWTDTQTNDDTGLDTVSMSYDGSSNSELLAELVVAGNVVNFYVRDYDLTGADYIVKLPETSTWTLESVNTVMMIHFDVPASLQSQFPDLGDEGGLYPFFAEYGGFVRGGVRNQTGNITGDDNIFNGIALDEILANFDAPAAPDLTELIGTWVADTPSFTYGDPAVFHYFASTHYEVSGTCDADASIGLEYGTMTVNATDGTFTTSTSVNGRGLCSLADLAGPGTTLTVSGDRLTLDASGQLSTFSRLKGDLSPLVGSWVGRDITMGGDGGHFLLTFLDDTNYMFSEDCSNDGVVGTEYGTYSWDEGNTNQVTTTQVYDANGGDPGCGLSENTLGDWELVVAGDTLTLTVPPGGSDPGSIDLARHSPTFVPIAPPIAFVEPGATTLYNVELDDDTGDWVMQAIQFNGSGSVTVDLGGPTEDPGTYELIGGILGITGSLDLVDYIMIMSNDATTGANRVCWTDPYADLVNCSQPGTAFLFDNQTDAQNFLNARITGTAFSGSAINASTVFAAGAGISLFELDDYYDGVADDWFEAPLFFTVSANGTTATDDEYQLIDGNWELSTDSFDIALTSTGWKPNVDWRFDTSSYADPVATISNVEVSETLQSLDFSFSEMDINTLPIYDFVDAEISVLLVNGTFGPGANVYETTITWNNDYYYINEWGSNCDDGSGGNFNGNCNVAQQRVLNRGTGEVTGFSNPTGTAFLNDNTATIELGWNGSMSLLGVFTSGGVLEFWEVNWSVSNIATQAISGTWATEVVGTETLVKYVVPVALQNAYQVQGDDSPEVFLSEQNGYMRFGEKEDEAGQMETVYFFNDAALDDINNSIPGAPTLP